MNEVNYKRINKIVKNSFDNMFSTLKLRILSAHKNNPELFKHVTLILDRHDSRFNYVDTEIKHSRLYSYKFKKNGLRTQIVSDMNDMILFISKSNFCSDSSDGTMFLNMKLYNKMENKDILAIDGGYTLFIQQFIDIASEKKYNFSDDNFVYPIRKKINESLSITEIHFNKIFGSFHSKIENQFSEISGKFNRFNNNKSVVRMDNVKFYNLQFKIACLLKNISKFVELFHIPTLPHHKLWEVENFEFPLEKKLIDIVVSNDKQNKDKLNKMIELQNSFLNLNIINNSSSSCNSSSNYNSSSNQMILDNYINIESNKKTQTGIDSSS